MKNLLLITALVVNACYGIAQTRTAKPKVRIHIGGNNGVQVEKGDKKIIGKHDKNSTNKVSRTFQFDLGFNNFSSVNPPNSLPYTIAGIMPQPIPNPGLPSDAGKVSSLALNNNKSINVGLYPFMYSFHLHKKSVNITAGLGVNWFNYRFENNVSFQKNTSPIAGPGEDVAVVYSTETNIAKNKVAASYLTLPISLQFKPKFGNRKLVVGGGVSVGYLLKGWHKTKTTSGAKDHETISEVFNPFQVNALAELGISNRIRLYESTPCGIWCKVLWVVEDFNSCFKINNQILNQNIFSQIIACAY
jgi:hypothetical protein